MLGAKKKKEYVSVDIGNKNIKIVHGCEKVGKKKIEIYHYEIVKTPLNSISDGRIIDFEAISQAIQEVLKNNNIKTQNLIMCVSGTGVITRDMQVPKSTDSEIAQIIQFEAQQYFPVDLTNYITDFKILEENITEEGVFYKILVAAVPQKQVDDYMKIPEKLKLNLKAIDLSANCILKYMFAHEYLETDYETLGLPREFAVLNIGDETTEVCIFCENKLKFNRILLNGSSDIDKQISSELDVSLEEAEKYKIQKTILEPDNEKGKQSDDTKAVSDIVKSSINVLAEDITRFLEFYISRDTGNKIEKVFICGGGSKLQGMDGYFSKLIGISVEYVSSTRFGIDYAGERGIEELNRDFVFLVNAIGALVRD